MRIVKDALDIGLYTNRRDEGLEFWGRRVGLAYEELLKAGGGVHQHRHTLGRGVLKLNHAREPLGAAPGGFVALRIARPIDEPVTLVDPDGLEVTLGPLADGVVTEVTWRTADAGAAADWLEGALGAVRRSPGTWVIGETAIRTLEDPAQPPAGPLRARGLRYLTVQVDDVEAAHDRILGLGHTEGTPPVRLGDVAYISFVRDPDGNHWELSQRASLTGPLPDRPRRRR